MTLYWASTARPAAARRSRKRSGPTSRAPSTSRAATSPRASPRRTSSSSAPTARASSTRATSSRARPSRRWTRSATSPCGRPPRRSSTCARKSPRPWACPSTRCASSRRRSAAASAASSSSSSRWLPRWRSPASVFELRTGVARDGTLTALQARVIFDAGAYAGAPVGIACLMLGSCYRLPHLDIRGYEVLTHKPGNGAYRAPGAVQAAFALESQMDDMARALGLDPLDFRLQNASGEGDLMANGNKWPRIGLRQCLEGLKAERDRRKTAAPAHGRLKRGVGVALGGWMGGIEPANAVCRLERDGTLSIIVGTVDMSGTNTAFAQIASEGFELPAGLIRVVNADTEAAPYAGSSGGSKITYTVGAAVEKAARDARQQLFAIAARHLEAAVEDLELLDRP